MSDDFVHMRIDDLGIKLMLIQQAQQQPQAQMELLYKRVFEYMEEGQQHREAAAAPKKRAASAEVRAAAAEERAAAAEQAATKLEQSLGEIKGWLRTAYNAIQHKNSSIKSRVSALEVGHREHQGAQSSDRQLVQEQLQVLIDEQRKLREQLTQIQQQKKPTMTSNTSKSIQQTSSCSSSSEHEQAQKVIKKYDSK